METMLTVRWLTAVLAGVAAVSLASLSSAAAALPELSDRAWLWPVESFRLVRPYEAPAHEYGPGHRGIDLAPVSDTVRAPASGLVAFAGPVAGRGVMTIDHGDGLVTTLEPVRPLLAAGAVVAKGEEVAVLAEGGHAAHSSLHLGVRWHGEYINPLLLLGGVPRAVLLPCC